MIIMVVFSCLSSYCTEMYSLSWHNSEGVVLSAYVGDGKVHGVMGLQLQITLYSILQI